MRVWSASGQLLDKLPFSHKGYNSDSDSEEEDEEDALGPTPFNSSVTAPPPEVGDCFFRSDCLFF